MKSKTPIYVVHEPDRGRTAFRFVAVLCFVEFYVYFVCFGMTIWTQGGVFLGSPSALLDSELWLRITAFATTPILYLCGRALWRCRRRPTFWLLTGIICQTTLVLLELLAGAMDSTYYDSSEFLQDPASAVQLLSPSALLAGVQEARAHIPLWVTLIVLWRVTRPAVKAQASHRAYWVWCAAAYCITWALSVLSQDSHVCGFFHYAMPHVTDIAGSAYLPITLYGLVLIGTAYLLLTDSRIARSMAMIVAAVHLVVVSEALLVISHLVRIATDALMYSVPFSTPVERPYVLTKHEFIWSCVMPAHYLIPWLLIAVYAWRVPMRKPAEDDTPFPRRFCAHCLYNLYGNKSDRCPECGHALSLPD